jgi:hypothetical protein
VDATVAWPRWQKRGPVAFWTGGERLNEIRDPEMRFQSLWTYLTQHDKFKGPPCISLIIKICYTPETSRRHGKLFTQNFMEKLDHMCAKTKKIQT